MPTYRQDDIERVRESNNIVDVIGSYVQLKRAGHNHMGLCPFHGEKSASFSVSEDKQLYHCFGCKKSGNVFTFVQDFKGFTFPEALEYLADRVSFRLTPVEVPGAKPKVEKSWLTSAEKINEYAAKFYHQQLMKLPSTHPIKQYIAERKLKKETVEQFRLGWANENWNDLTDSLARVNAPLETAQNLGLLRPKKQGGGYYDLFRSRLIFPIQDVKGSVIGFGGRIVGEGQPKYLNSHESELFHKGKIFYGLGETRKHIRDLDQVLVVEGYMDFLALYQAGVTNVVATLGTALTPMHAKALRKMTLNVCMVFDGDAAGVMATERSLSVLLAEGLRPTTLTLPDQLDPDEWIHANGAQAFKELVAKAEDSFTVYLRRKTLGEARTAAEKLKVMDEIAPVIATTSDPRMKELIIETTATALNVDAGWVRKHLSSMNTQASSQAGSASAKVLTETTPPRVVQTETRISLKGASRLELELLKLALSSENLWHDFWGSGVKTFMSAEVQKVFELADDAYRQISNKFASLPAFLASYVEPASALSFEADKMWLSMSGEKAQATLNDCIKKLKDKDIKNQAKKTLAQLKSKSSEDQMKELEQFMNIQTARNRVRPDKES